MLALPVYFSINLTVANWSAVKAVLTKLTLVLIQFMIVKISDCHNLAKLSHGMSQLWIISVKPLYVQFLKVSFLRRRVLFYRKRIHIAVTRNSSIWGFPCGCLCSNLLFLALSYFRCINKKVLTFYAVLGLLLNNLAFTPQNKNLSSRNAFACCIIIL
jgi:hypothetical protein